MIYINNSNSLAPKSIFHFSSKNIDDLPEGKLKLSYCDI